MSISLYFYDLETSGFNPRTDRVMQFGGQRTDMNLRPIGEPDNILIALTQDVLPSPDAILVTGITPQKTISEGYSEAEFLKIFSKTIATPGTIFVGFNSIRFDDEFMRFMLYRNFYDAYEWQWKDGRSRWDMLDVVRMTRALRPGGIAWPFDSLGKPSNRLELLASVNKLAHTHAHDALSDVQATRELAHLLQTKQPKLFNYLLDMRDKKKISALVNSGRPFVYSSGKYAGEFEKTTAVIKLLDHPKKQAALVYDLRVDPAPFLKLTAEEIAEAWKYKKDSEEPRLPVKTLQFNKCPAVAPLGVLGDDSQKRLGLDLATIEGHAKKLRSSDVFAGNVLKAIEIMDKKLQVRLLENETTVDGQLYDGFVGDEDKSSMRKVLSSKPDALGTSELTFKDDRLTKLLPLYKARNFPKQLSDEERTAWEEFRIKKLTKELPGYVKRLEELAQTNTSSEKQYLLEELKLYAESIAP